MQLIMNTVNFILFSML